MLVSTHFYLCISYEHILFFIAMPAYVSHSHLIPLIQYSFRANCIEYFEADATKVIGGRKVEKGMFIFGMDSDFSC